MVDLVRPAPGTRTDRWAPAPPSPGTRRPLGGASGSARPVPLRARVLRAPGFGGSLVALVLLCLSTTPSLLPRPWLLQALLSGVTMVTGYAAGCAGAGLVSRLCRRPPRAPHWAWLVLAVTGTCLAATGLHLAGGWQRELRHVTGMPPGPWHPVLILVVAVAVAVGLLMAARTVRWVTAALAGWCGRWLPRSVALVAAATAVATAGYALGTAAFLQVVDHVATAANRDTHAGSEPSVSPYVSGGPGSLVSWESLGAQGRKFVAGAVPVPELGRFRPGGGGARPPVRVYVGADSAPGPSDRAALAVRELERTGGFDREVLVVVATTGSGWVNPVVTEAVEYLYRGDTAAVATQYSHRPSWVSFVTDRGAAVREAAALVTTVGRRVAELPPARRPTVLVYGESLGAYAVERALRHLPDPASVIDAGVLVGQPLGRTGHAAAVDGDGDRPLRLVHLQHTDDPVVRWSPRLWWQRPPWLGGHHGPDGSGRMRWYPAVTFWQVTVDLLTSTRVPAGHGHAYRQEIVDAVAALVPPAGWTGADTRRLREVAG